MTGYGWPNNFFIFQTFLGPFGEPLWFLPSIFEFPLSRYMFPYFFRHFKKLPTLKKYLGESRKPKLAYGWPHTTDINWQIWIVTKLLKSKVKYKLKLNISLCRCPYLPTDDNKMCIFVESVAPVKIMNLEEYPSITTRVTARRLIFCWCYWLRVCC